MILRPNIRNLVFKPLLDNTLALALLLIVSFVLLHSLPGNQADALLSSDIRPDISADDYAQVQTRLGLDQSRLDQFITWLGGLLQGEMGYSFLYSAPITEVLMGALPWTLALVLMALPISLISGSLLGLLVGMAPTQTNSRLLVGLATLFSSLPGFVVALLLLSLFGFALGWFPTGGGISLEAKLRGSFDLIDWAHHALLPVLALSIHGSVRYFYLAYGLAQQIGRRQFIQHARLRGIRGWRLLWRWYLPNAMPELLSRLSSGLPGVVGASLLVEVVFSYPGSGALMLDAIHNRDYQLLQGGLLLTGSIVLLGNTLLDFVTAALTNRG
jgi:peptide/nickel transport system permease protein